jgi:hypothetical protein
VQRVVPQVENGRVSDEAVAEFKQELTSRVWRTDRGSNFLHWFWKSRFGLWLSKRFADAEAPELHGYAFWGPVALAIATIEVLGATSRWFRNLIPWTTISRTVGHIQDVDSRWGLAVVGIIAATFFYAISYAGEAPSTGTTRFFSKFRYGWPLVYAATAVVFVFVLVFVSDEKIHLGYAIYGSFAVFGIVLPMLLVWRKSNHVVFPNVFYTFRKLRERFRWVAMVVVMGLTVLVFHLALYPWPDLAREPAKYAGVSELRAREKATNALESTRDVREDLKFSAQGRGFSDGREAWLVHFNVGSGDDSIDTGCIVTVTRTRVKPSGGCSQQ